MKCPVCKTEVEEHHTICPICDFFGLHIDFVNKEDALHWKRSVLPYYQAIWKRKQFEDSPQINLSSAESIAIFEKYFSDAHYKYRLEVGMNSNNATILYAKKMSLKSYSVDSIDINLKYRVLEIVADGISFIHTYCENDIYYSLNGNVVAIYYDSAKKDCVCAVEIDNELKLKEFITVLEFARAGTTHFTFPFDSDKRSWKSLSQDDITFTEYFRGDLIKPLTTRAEVSDFYESEKFGEQLRDRGLCEITINVSSSDKKDLAFADIYDNDSSLFIGIDRVNETQKWILPQGIHIPLNKDENTLMYDGDVFINEELNTVYIGNWKKYTAFCFEELAQAEQMFNYVAMIGPCWSIYNWK